MAESPYRAPPPPPRISPAARPYARALLAGAFLATLPFGWSRASGCGPVSHYDESGITLLTKGETGEAIVRTVILLGLVAIPIASAFITRRLGTSLPRALCELVATLCAFVATLGFWMLATFEIMGERSLLFAGAAGLACLALVTVDAAANAVEQARRALIERDRARAPPAPVAFGHVEEVKARIDAAKPPDDAEEAEREALAVEEAKARRSRS